MINESDSTLSGIYTYLKQIEPALENQGWEVFYIFLSTKESDRQTKTLKIKIPKGNKIINFYKKNIWSTEVYYSIKNFIEDVNPDIVHLHNFYYYQNPLKQALKNKAVVQTVHDYGLVNIFHDNIPDDFLIDNQKQNSNLISRRTGLFIDRTIFNSLKARRQLVKKFIAPTRDLTTKLKSKNLPSLYLPYSSRPNFLAATRSDKTNTVIYTGRLERTKGMACLLKAFEKVAKKFSDCRLVLAGQGQAEIAMKKYIQTKTIKNQIIFTGHLQNQELLKLLKTAKVAVCPSLWLENSPLSVIESLAVGVPTIASNIGGLPEMIIDGQNGFLIEPGNVEQLANKMTALLTNDKLNEDMGKKAKALSFLRPNPQTHVKQLINIYSEL